MVQPRWNRNRSSAEKASDVRVSIKDKELTGYLTLLHEHDNEPYTLEYWPIIAAA